MDILPPVSLAGLSNRLVITCFFLHQKVAVTLLLPKVASVDICDKATEAVCVLPKTSRVCSRVVCWLQGCSPRVLAQGLLSKPESSADISPKTPIAPYCAVPLLSAISRLLLLFDITIPNTLGAPALFAVEVILA